VAEMEKKIATPFGRPFRCSRYALEAENIRMQNEAKKKHDREDGDCQSGT